MLYKYTLPPMSDEFYERLMNAFRPVEISPDTPMQAIQYSAGQQKVLDWITREIGKKKATSTCKVKTWHARAVAAWQLIWRGYVD